MCFMCFNVNPNHLKIILVYHKKCFFKRNFDMMLAVGKRSRSLKSSLGGQDF